MHYAIIHRTPGHSWEPVSPDRYPSPVEAASAIHYDPEHPEPFCIVSEFNPTLRQPSNHEEPTQ